jgi:hypothetical protein
MLLERHIYGQSSLILTLFPSNPALKIAERLPLSIQNQVMPLPLRPDYPTSEGVGTLDLLKSDDTISFISFYHNIPGNI